ncbi:MAG: hypothetical protein ACT4P1_15925 [Sporichthyaceae bacterium]
MTTFAERIEAVDAHLSAAEIAHAFGGAIALAYHIENPRATDDIDVNITADPSIAESVLRALPPGVTWSAPDVARIAAHGQARVFWDRIPLDLFFPQHELHEVVAGRVEWVPFGGTRIPIVSATDLTIFKALFDRGQDWIDIEHMWVYGKVDRSEVRAWLVRLLGGDDHRLARLDKLPGR